MLDRVYAARGRWVEKEVSEMGSGCRVAVFGLTIMRLMASAPAALQAMPQKDLTVVSWGGSYSRAARALWFGSLIGPIEIISVVAPVFDAAAVVLQSENCTSHQADRLGAKSDEIGTDQPLPFRNPDVAYEEIALRCSNSVESPLSDL